MFENQKPQAPTDESVRKLETCLLMLKITSEFFPGCQIRQGERLEDVAARSLGITREAFDQTFLYLRSIGAGRVIKPGE